MTNFVHLHCHSDYSTFDGFQTVYDIAKRASDIGMEAIALTDHGKVGGLIKFYKECRRECFEVKNTKEKDVKIESLNLIVPSKKKVDLFSGTKKSVKELSSNQEIKTLTSSGVLEVTECKYKVKPILGVEMYFSNDLSKKKDDRYHLIILAKNVVGYKNIIKLSSEAHRNMAYGYPRIDWDILCKYKDGLVIMTACLGGEIPNKILLGDIEGAKDIAKKYKSVFGEDFYLEAMYNGKDGANLKESQQKVLKEIVVIGKELDIKVVATNDAHYITRDMAKYQQVKKAISMKKPLEYADSDQYYIKTAEEMEKLYTFPAMEKLIGDCGKELLENSVEIANKCNVEIEFGYAKLPEFKIPEDDERYNVFKERLFGLTEEQKYLKYLAFCGLEKRGLDKDQKYIDRLNVELETIRFTGFDRYFLIVKEFIDYARSQNIGVGSGRGSGYGSLVLFCLWVTDGLDPVEYKLTMDRFLYAEAEYRMSAEDVFSDSTKTELITTSRGNRDRVLTVEEQAVSAKLIDKCKKLLKEKTYTSEEIKRVKEELNFIRVKPALVEDVFGLVEQYNGKKGDINKNNSFILYLIGITNKECDLSKDFFFRHIVDKNQSRISPPDIDIDFEHREAILRHICALYGKEKVALIGTNTGFKPKAAVQFAAKAIDITGTNNLTDKRFSSENDKEGKRLSKIMTNFGATLKQWLGEEEFKVPNRFIKECMDNLKAEQLKGGKYAEVFEVAKQLEGIIKSYGTHAAGVVISSQDITEDIPLHVAKVVREQGDYDFFDEETEEEEEDISDLMTTQYDMAEVEELGLLKFDFLQLITLRQMSLTLDLIKEIYGEVNFDINKLIPNDKRVFNTIKEMKLEGLFQISGTAFRGGDFPRYNKEDGDFGKAGEFMVDPKTKKNVMYHRDGVMKIIGCDSFNDIVAPNALGRPGPLACGMVQKYADVKFGKSEAIYLHPLLAEILKPTNAQMIYQEQMIQISQKLAGFTFAEADKLRKACAKKRKDLLEDIEVKFKKGCKKNNVSDNVANEIFDNILSFGEYAFNSAHCLSGDACVYDVKNDKNKHVKDVEKGDVILSYDGAEIVKDEVLELIDTGTQDVYEVVFDNGMKIRSTLNHKFLCVDKKYRTVEKIFSENFEVVYILSNTVKSKIISVEYLSKEQTYNIGMVSDQHNYLVVNEDGHAVVSKNSHAYGFLCYQTAYLKTYYPAEFICSLLTSSANKSDEKLQETKDALSLEYKKNLRILPPSINLSKKTYYPESSKEDCMVIREPFFAIKGIGQKLSDEIVKKRDGIKEFISVDNFIQTMSGGTKGNISETVLTMFVELGVFDELSLPKSDIEKDTKEVQAKKQKARTNFKMAIRTYNSNKKLAKAGQKKDLVDSYDQSDLNMLF